MCKRTAEPDTAQMIIWRMSIACWILKATNTYSACLTLTAFPLQQWLHKRASMLRYTYTACLVSFREVFVNQVMSAGHIAWGAVSLLLSLSFLLLILSIQSKCSFFWGGGFSRWYDSHI